MKARKGVKVERTKVGVFFCYVPNYQPATVPLQVTSLQSFPSILEAV